MKVYSINDSIHCLHADIETTDLFEGIWPIPHGVSLNCYLVKGEKTALIDLFRDWTDAPSQIEAQLQQLGHNLGSIDYLILNHLEPDHTGYLCEFRKKNPQAIIISTARGIKLVSSF